MKKHLLVIVAVCLVTLPAMANDLAEDLCADEVFVSMVKETTQVVKHMQSLPADQFNEYLRSEEFACFSEKFIHHREYLSVRFNLFERSDREIVISKAIKKVTMQKDPRYCETYYNLLFMSCWGSQYAGPEGTLAQMECFAYAQQWYNNCMAGTGGGVE